MNEAQEKALWDFVRAFALSRANDNGMVGAAARVFLMGGRASVLAEEAPPVKERIPLGQPGEGGPVKEPRVVDVAEAYGLAGTAYDPRMLTPEGRELRIKDIDFNYGSMYLAHKIPLRARSSGLTLTTSTWRVRVCGTFSAFWQRWFGIGTTPSRWVL